MAYYYTPFFEKYIPPAEGICLFCEEKNISAQLFRDKENKPIENEYFYWIANWFPKYEGTTMIVPKRHITSLSDITPAESVARDALIARASCILSRVYPGSGTEIFMQTGTGSYSSVPHLHWHVFPAEKEGPFVSYEKTGRFFTTVPKEQKIILFPIEIQLAKETLIEAVKKVA